MDREVEAFRFTSGLTDEEQRQIKADIFNHHLLVVGQTGSGKTTTTLSLLNQLQHLNQTTIVLDPTGEYAQLPNAITYRLGENAYLEAGTLSANELQEVLGLHLPAAVKDKLTQAISSLRICHNLYEIDGTYKKIGRAIDQYQGELYNLGSWATDYNPQYLFAQLIEELVVPYSDDRADYRLLGQEYNRTAINHYWGTLTAIRERLDSPLFSTVFDTQEYPGTFKTELSFVLQMFLNHRSTHRTLVIDLSILKKYGDSQREIISFILKKVLQMRFQKPQPYPVNIVIDEAHRYLPQLEEQLPDNGIFQVLREGRKLNLKMILTTQSPLDLPARLRSQFRNVVVHRLLDSTELTSFKCKNTFIIRCKPIIDGTGIFKDAKYYGKSIY